MADESIPVSLQQSLLALLFFDKAHGASVAAQVEPSHFDDINRDVAERVLRYWRDYHRPPGKSHIDDLFADELRRGKESAAGMRRFLADLLELADGLNAPYIAGRVGDFIASQRIKGFLLEASDLYNQQQVEAVEPIRNLMLQTLRGVETGFTPGIYLDDVDSLSFLERAQTDTIPLDIHGLDEKHIGLNPGELLLFIAPKGKGKTWFCIHCGKQALLQRERVVHITLEFRAHKTIGRYFQALYSSGWQKSYDYFPLLDKKGDVLPLPEMESKKETRKPNILLSAGDARKKLQAKQKSWGARLGNIVVKEFPTGTLTIAQLSAYLDYLEMEQRFIPTVLIVDYPDLMKQDTNNYRMSLGTTFEQLRGVAGERNLALVCPTQSTRASYRARHVSSDMVSEDVRKVNTADTVLTYSQTRDEKRMGLARIELAHARDVQDQHASLITQAYSVGQFVIESHELPADYWDRVSEDSEG